MRATRAVLAPLLVATLLLGGLAGSPPAGADRVPPGGTTAATCFTDLVHEIFLQRRVTQAELDAWVPALVDGTPRHVLVQALAGSDEWLTVTVTELYQQALDRDPDPDGLAHWVAKLRAGVLVNRIGAQIFGSPEFYARADSDDLTFVALLYRWILEREAEETEVAYWAGQIEARGRGGVASQLSASYESRARRVGGLYKRLLARQPQEADVAYWAERLRRVNDVRLAMLIASGSELEALSRATCLDALQIVTDDLPSAFTGLAYAVALDGRGGIPPHTWTAEGLPPGLAVVGDEIQGTPTEGGTFTVTLRLTDAEAAEDVTTLDLVVDPPT